MKKFLVRLFFPNDEVLLTCYVVAASEEEAAQKIGADYDEDDKSWSVLTENDEHFITFQEITEISTPDQFNEIVGQQEQRWKVLHPEVYS